MKSLPLRNQGGVEKYRYIIAALVRHRQIGFAVPVGVPHRHEVRTRAGGIEHRRLEGAVAIAQEHVDAARVRHRQIGFAVSIEVSHRHGGRTRAGGIVHWRLEGAVAIAQEHVDVVAVHVRHRQIGFAVPIEVPHRTERGLSPTV